MSNRGKYIRKPNGASVTKWMIAVYIRLSREDGNDESRSVTNQRDILDEFIRSYFEDEYTVVDYYIDDGLTGTDDTRESFTRMIEDARAGKVNCIVCKTLSRAFRNYADQGRYLEQIFPVLGLRFISEGNPRVDSYLDPAAIQHGLEIPINGLMNDRYAAKTSADVRRTFDSKRSRGEFIGAFAPYGYSKDPENKNHLLIDEDAAQIVRYIYRWFIEGLSKGGIARKLNGEGVPSPALYKRSKGLNFNNPSLRDNRGLWTPTSVAHILHNRMYLGHMVQGVQRVISYKVHDLVRVPEPNWVVVENTHEAIISEADFEKAQSLHRRETKVAPGKSEVPLLSGFIRCADCNRAMRRKTGGDRKNAYYVCRTGSDLGLCEKRSIREDVLVRAILDAIQAQVYTVCDMAELVARIKDAPVRFVESSRIVQSLDSNRAELKKAVGKADDLYDNYAEGLITKEEYLRMKGRYEKQAEDLKAIVERLEHEQQALSSGVKETDPYFESFIKRHRVEGLTRPILAELVENVYVHKDKSLTVELKLKDRHMEIAEHIQATGEAR